MVGRFCSIAGHVRINFRLNEGVDRVTVSDGQATAISAPSGVGPDDPAFFDWTTVENGTNLGHDVRIRHGAIDGAG